jgi:hypothetical protein
MLYSVVACVATLAGGLSLGWYLRKKERWCPECGGVLTCPECRLEAAIAGAHRLTRPRGPYVGRATVPRRIPMHTTSPIVRRESGTG